MVGGDHGLALAGVDQDRVDGLAGDELDGGGEARAAHAGNASVLNDLYDVLGAQVFQGALGLDGFVESVLVVVADHHGQAASGGGVDALFDGDDFAADAGVDRRADESGLLADLLADLDMIAYLHDGVGGLAGGLREGDDHDIRLGEDLNGAVLAHFLALGRMHTAVIAVQTLLANGLHIFADDLEIDFVVVAQLYRLLFELFEPSGLLKLAVDLLPGAVFVGIDLTLAVLCTAALSVEKTLGAVDHRADAPGDVQEALRAGVTGFFGKSHAVMTCVIEGIAGSEDGLLHQLRHSLDAQTAGDHEHALGALGDHSGQLPLGLDPVAQKIDLEGARDGFALFLGKLYECLAVGLIDGCELLEALVAGNNEDLVRTGEHRGELFGILQPVLGIVLQFLTFLT